MPKGPSKPNAVQEEWREDVRKLGSAISGMLPCEIHHAAGRTAIHNKVHIGHWWIIPLTKREHVEVVKGRGRKQREKELFLKVCDLYVAAYSRLLPFGQDVEDAIQDYHL